MTTRAPKLVFVDEADAAKEIDNFKSIREMSNEAAAANNRLRDAFNAFYDKQLKADPLWDGLLVDGEHGLRMTRNEQPFGHYFAVRDMPNEMILWLAEHGCLETNNAAVEVFMGGDAPPRELIDIAKFKHAKARVTLTIEEAK